MNTHGRETFSCMYRRPQYNKRFPMPAEKSVAVSFRVTPRFKLLLEAAAASEHRSQTNMLEMLLFEFCAKNRIQPTTQDTPVSKVAMGGTEQ